jgi:hypothetical protein
MLDVVVNYLYWTACRMPALAAASNEVNILNSYTNSRNVSRRHRKRI